jgi:hypothetical protein
VTARAYVLDVERAVDYHRGFNGDSDEQAVLEQIAERKHEVDPEQQQFASECDRWDNLYYPDTILPHAGASHWAEHPSATTPGRTHISLNVPPVYVDVPASLQSVPPVENMVSNLPDDTGRQMAAMVERVYFAWKEEETWDLKCHRACVTKSLYGRTAAKVYWDDEKQRPCVTVVDQPRNLYFGWGDSDYSRLNWSLYVYRQTPEQVAEEWGLDVSSEEDNKGNVIPFVLPRGGYDHSSPDFALPTTTRARPAQPMEVEVYDYWYRKPKKTQPKRGSRYKGIAMETWNAIFVGNECVKNEVHKEFDGRIPYVPLFNTFIPGVPSGRPELFDIEMLIREKDERLSAGGQMLNKTIDGQYWQLVGPEAPDVVPAGATPKANKVATPGAGNRIESIDPWMPEFQLEAYLGRIDREMTDVSGLNDLLRGLAPATVLSSSKAITALVANYEARIRIKRDLFYQFRSEVWMLVALVWGSKQSALRPLFDGIARLVQTAPSLTPRDDMETSAMAANLVQSKLWSQKRGMDRVGVDDPETEADIIRSERTDASMFPADVATMAQLMTVLQSLGYGAPPAAEEALGQQAGSLAEMRAQLGGRSGVPSLNAPEEQPGVPPEGMPANTPEGAEAAGVIAPEGGAVPLAEDIRSQTMLQGGETTGRILTDTRVPV